MKQQYDICVVGAGVAGGVIAARLADLGHHVVIIERDYSEQDRIVGELLQPGGVQKLKEMNLDHLLEGIDGHKVPGYAMFLDDSNFQIEYPKAKETVYGLGFRNGKFVQKIRAYIQQHENVTCLTGNVTELIEDEDAVYGVKFTTPDSDSPQEIKAHLNIISEGPFSMFRDRFNKAKKEVSGYFIGIVLDNAELPYPSHGHLVLSDPSPFLMYPISSTETRVLVDFPGAKPPRIGEALKEKLKAEYLPSVPKATQPAFEAAIDKGDFKMMPNHRLPAMPINKKGAVLLGDSLNMRHPLTGGGMTAAFTDVQNLADQVKDVNFSDAQAVYKAIDLYYNSRHSKNATINILADALYGVMSNPRLRKACFEYLQKGGKKSQEPIAILSALSRNQRMLEKHFFAVAFDGAKKEISEKKNIKSIRESITMIRDALNIVAPLLLAEKPKLPVKLFLKMLRYNVQRKAA